MKALSVFRLVKSRASHSFSLRGRRAAAADKPPYLEALEGRVLPSLTPHLVKDLNPSLASSRPVELVEVGGTAYFYANDGIHGYELWKSNGTAAGTTLVKDIRPGNRGSYFYPYYVRSNGLTNVNGTLFFVADDGVHGSELWRSNGTAAGTLMVKDIHPGFTPNVYPAYLTNVNGTLFFSADDGTSGKELWRSNGTASGTVLVKDINSGPYGSTPMHLTNVNGTLFFAANPGPGASEDHDVLWRSNGTANGTQAIKDINPGRDPPTLNYLTNVNGTLFFSGLNVNTLQELWKSDGTPAGTLLVKDINPGHGSADPKELTAVGNTLFFVADNGVSGRELWRSNGTAAGTVLMRDIFPNPGGYNEFPGSLTNDSGTLFFSANDGTHGSALWRSNGTSAGTTMVKAVLPSGLANVGGRLFFVGFESAHGEELWQSNGTAAGTQLVADIVPGPGHSYGNYLTNINGTLFFQDNNAVNGAELWESNGTSAGTLLVKDIWRGSYGSYPRYFTNLNGTLFFQAADFGSPGSNRSFPLWRSDGTATGTEKLTGIGGGASGLYPEQMTNVNGTLFFSATIARYELWRSDGTAAGTSMVKFLGTFEGGSYPENLTNVNDTLFFTADDGTYGRELWRSDGTAAETVLVKDIYPGLEKPGMKYSSTPSYLTNLGGTLFFAADDGTHGRELWRTNGTAAGTALIKDIFPGSKGVLGYSSNPQYLTNVNGILFFSADNGVGGRELWRSNGTTAGTVLVKNINAGGGSSSPANLTNLSGTLFFTADDGTRGIELWRSNGAAAGTAIIKDIDPGSGGSLPSALTNVGGTLFFTATNGVSGLELWRSNGTAPGTVLVKDIDPGPLGSVPNDLVNVNGTLFFSATNGISGFELWQSNGTAPGTVLVQDILPGGGSSYPSYLTNVNGSLFFSAKDGTHGDEPWVLGPVHALQQAFSTTEAGRARREPGTSLTAADPERPTGPFTTHEADGDDSLRLPGVNADARHAAALGKTMIGASGRAEPSRDESLGPTTRRLGADARRGREPFRTRHPVLEELLPEWIDFVYEDWP